MPGTLVVLMLSLWVGATAVLLLVGPVGKFLWVPVLLAMTGVLCSILPLVTSWDASDAVNGAILLFFIIAMAGIQKREQQRTVHAHRLTRSR